MGQVGALGEGTGPMPLMVMSIKGGNVGKAPSTVYATK